jgi:hypothetical protein
MKKSAFGIATALVAFASPTHAAPLLFTFSDMNNSSFQLDSNPVSTPSSIFSFTTPVTNGMQNGTAFDFGTVRFFSSISGGGVFSGFGSPGGFGPQLFSGTTAKPVFSPGTFSFTDFRCCARAGHLGDDAGRVRWGRLCDPASQTQGHYGYCLRLINICPERHVRKPPFWKENGGIVVFVDEDEHGSDFERGRSAITIIMAATVKFLGLLISCLLEP